MIRFKIIYVENRWELYEWASGRFRRGHWQWRRQAASKAELESYIRALVAAEQARAPTYYDHCGKVEAGW